MFVITAHALFLSYYISPFLLQFIIVSLLSGFLSIQVCFASQRQCFDLVVYFQALDSLQAPIASNDTHLPLLLGSASVLWSEGVLKAS